MAVPIFDVFCAEFKAKVKQEFDNNWENAYQYYFKPKAQDVYEQYY